VVLKDIQDKVNNKESKLDETVKSLKAVESKLVITEKKLATAESNLAQISAKYEALKSKVP